MAELPPPAPRPTASVGRVILRNTLFITLGGVILKILNFAYGVYVVRRLGDSQFGQYNIILAWVGLFSIFAELGVTQYAMREIARDHQRAEGLFWNLMAMRAVLALAGMLGITAGAAAVGYSAEIVTGVFVYTSSFLLSAVGVSLTMVLAAYERLDFTTLTTIASQVVGLGLGLAVLWNGYGLIPFLAVGLLAMCPPILWSIWFVWKHQMLAFKPQIDVRTWPALARGGWPFALISLALTIAFSIDTVMLSWYVPEAHVGWYNVAYGLARSLVALLGGFSVALVPSLARAYSSDTATVERWYYRAVKFFLLVSLPVAAGGMLIAFPLVQLVYNPTTLPAALALQILIWDVPLLMFTALCGNMSYVIGGERAAARIYAINAVANVLLNLYAIPRFGVVGAAIVTVVTDLIGALQFQFLLNRRLRLPAMGAVVVRIAGATLCMALAVYGALGWHVGVLIGLGGAVYVLAVIALRVLDASDWALAQQMLGRLARWRGAGGRS